MNRFISANAACIEYQGLVGEFILSYCVSRLRGALEEEKSKCQHLGELLERERSSLRQMRSKVEGMKLDSDNKERNELLIEVRCMYYYEMLV
jgi:hypothetical protein